MFQTFHYYHPTRDARAGAPGLATFFAPLRGNADFLSMAGCKRRRTNGTLPAQIKLTSSTLVS